VSDMRRPILFTVCVWWLFFATFCQVMAQSSHLSNAESLDRALQLARAHRYAEAAAAIRGLPAPEDRQQRIIFFRLRASIESGLGHSAAAATDMEAAANLAPENVELQVAAKLARLELQLESHADSALTLQTLRGITLPPDRLLEVRSRTAELLSRANLYGEAAKDFEDASRLAPGRPDILFNLAIARYRNGEWDASLASAEQARTVEDSGPLESLLGDLHEKRGDALAAVHSYQMAVTLEPRVEEHRLALARELLKHQTFDAAIVVLDQSAELFPQSVHIKILQGLTYYLVDRSADSVRTLLEATKLDPKDELAERYLGEITLQDPAAPHPDAVAQICAFADAHPSSKSASALCGGVLLRVSEESADDSSKPAILRRLQQAVRIAPQEPLARCQLGKAFEWSHQWQDARGQLEKCVRLEPDSPEGHYRLARVYRRLGLSSQADEQTALQQQAAQRQSEESTRRTNTVTRFLVLFDH
jgi:tetratricopeptide (TPR) repeat protein